MKCSYCGNNADYVVDGNSICGDCRIEKRGGGGE